MAIVFTEDQALSRIADESWSRKGDILVSKDSFSEAAIRQYLDALSEETRSAIKFRSEPNSRWGGPATSADKKIVINASDAERVFAKHGLSLNLEDRSAVANRNV